MARITPIMKQFPSVARAVAKLPGSVVKRLWPDAGIVADLDEQMLGWILEHRAAQEKMRRDPGDGSMESKNLFEVIKDSKLPEADKSAPRLVEEAVSIIVAGSETTAKILTRAAYELMSNPSVLVKAREDLAHAARQLDKQQLELVDLEKLPYLASTLDLRCEVDSLLTRSRHRRL
jgi:hypothetical protein